MFINENLLVLFPEFLFLLQISLKYLLISQKSLENAKLIEKVFALGMKLDKWGKDRYHVRFGTLEQVLSCHKVLQYSRLLIVNTSDPQKHSLT